jgi:hypothetical protein
MMTENARFAARASFRGCSPYFCCTHFCVETCRNLLLAFSLGNSRAFTGAVILAYLINRPPRCNGNDDRRRDR